VLRAINARQFLSGALAKLIDPLWVVAAAALVGWGITQTAYWRHVELKLFDLMVVRDAPNKVELPITIIGIDEATFSALGSNWPLPRRHHAALLDKLKEAGVAVVGFDIAFPDESSKEDDALFAAAIKRFGNVVLASDFGFREDNSVRQWSRLDPHSTFTAAGARQGYVPFQVDEDAVLRRTSVETDAFWRVLLKELESLQPGVIPPLVVDESNRIRYSGGPQTFTYIPFFQLLDPDKHLPPHWKDFFKDNIVLVGRKVSVTGDVGAAQGETYQTPFFAKTREFMPRVEVHANLIANGVSGDILREVSSNWALAAWFVAVLGGLAFTRQWHPVRSGIVLGVLAVAMALIEYGMFQKWHLWLPAAGAIMTIALMYASQGAVAFIHEQRQRRDLREAFSKYVAPSVVEQVIADPSKLRLGGERREVTILFSDLAGFTSIAEKLEPEQVAAIVNRHLSDMTEAIQQHGGTVDKFIGDGIMAFWGAPVADPEQAAHAVQAAIEMQEEMNAMRAQIVEEMGVELRMRVGINRGECIVGNMGSHNRFEYTLMGDAVNLASRMEGVNKVYGTEILVSDSVASAARGKIKFREIDTVRVKGKRTGITIHAPCDDETLNAMTATALAAYRSGDFEASERSWQKIGDKFPQDPVAQVFLGRMAVLKSGGLADWDGITTLEEK
jgi:adenylate cyclase